MIPVYQQVLRHDPPRGIYGDCMRATVASIFDLELGQVPHFADESLFPDGHAKAMRDWLRPQGLTFMFYGVQLGEEFDTFRQNLIDFEIDAFHMLGGCVGSTRHMVVAQYGAMVHDPSGLNSSLEPDVETGSFDVGFFIKGGW